MKKFYVFTTVFMFIASLAVAQTTYYWIGGDGEFKLVSNAANWSLTSGGPAASSAPEENDIAVFDQNARVQVNAGSWNIGAVHIVNNSNVVFMFIADNPNVNYSYTGGYAFYIESGSVRKDSTTKQEQVIVHHFDANERGRIDGTYIIDATPGVPGSSMFKFPQTSGLSNTGMDIYGTLRYTPSAIIFNDPNNIAPRYIVFQDGSLVELQNPGGTWPKGTYMPNSTLYITGYTDDGGLPEPGFDDYGNLIYECANQSAEILLFLQQTKFHGNVEIRNTNGHKLALCTNVGSGLRYQIIKGDLIITGNSVVSAIEHGTNGANIILDIEGNLILDGEDFNIQSRNNLANSSYATLIVRGNIQHNSGQFRYTSNSSSTSEDLFVVELAGTSLQTIYSHNGTWSANNSELTLRINNPAGVQLNSSLIVGRLNFETDNKGVVYVPNPYYLHVRNTSAIPTSRAIRGESNSGYVQGRLRRTTGSVNIFKFPVGANGKLRTAYIQTTTNSASLYEVQYIPSPYTVTTPVAPLQAIAPDYFAVNTVSGVNAGTVALTVNGAIPGTQPFHGLVAAVYNGSGWERAGGAYLAPGNTTSGTVSTAEMPALTGFYTIGYANQSALPVHLTEFNAKKLNNTTSLVSWKITAESTPLRFEVLKSTNGRDFTVMESVNAVFRLQDYQVTDNRLGAGTTYYRLKMYDVDGEVTLSKIVAVMNGIDGVQITSVMPSVFNTSTKVNITSSQKLNMTLVVTDMYGRIVHRQMENIQSGNQEVTLPLHHLSSGTYFITGYYNGQKTATMKIIKQ